GFTFNDLVFESDNLPLDHDPKMAWALHHAAEFPVDVLRAPREMLLRVPGIGPRAVERLVAARPRTLARRPGGLRPVRIATGGRRAFHAGRRGAPPATPSG